MHKIASLMTSAVCTAGVFLPASAFADTSPLQVIVNGRDEAASSNLTRDGMVTIMEQSGDVVMYAAGLLGILLGSVGIFMLHRAQSEDDPRLTRRGWMMTFIGGFMTIPAFVAALVPHVLINGL